MNTLYVTFFLYMDIGLIKCLNLKYTVLLLDTIFFWQQCDRTGWKNNLYTEYTFFIRDIARGKYL